MLRRHLAPRRIFVAVVAAIAAVAMGLVTWLVLMVATFGNLPPIPNDVEGRAEVVELARAGALALPDDERRDWGDVFVLPDNLDHVSRGGEVVVQRQGGDLVVVFFDFRGLNHYTGWVYASGDRLTEDPLGESPYSIERIGPNWFQVDAG
jgi:hypothetical protein